MKKIILTMALAFAASVCFAHTTSNDNSNQNSSAEREYLSINETQQSGGWAGTYTLKGADGNNYKFVLKPNGTAVLYVNGQETDYGTWGYNSKLGYCRVSFDNTWVPLPGSSSCFIYTFYLKDGYAYVAGAQQSENPKKRVKYTKIK